MHLTIILSGFIASLVMMGLMQLITLSKIAEADMVRAIGSLITRRLHNCFWIGLAAYLLVGVGFSYLYALFILPMLNDGLLLAPVAASTLAGLAHGGIVGFALVIEVSDRHPVKRFRNAGFQVALAHIAGHIAYGFALALSMIALNGKLGALFSQLGQTPAAIFASVAALIALGLLVLSAWNENSHHNVLP